MSSAPLHLQPSPRPVPMADTQAPAPLPPRRSFTRAAWLLRIAVALLLMVLSAWSLLLPVSVPISTSAAVTARVAMVPVPIQGDILSLNADVGEQVQIGQTLAEVGDGHSSNDDLLELRTQRANLAAQKSAVDAELKEAKILRARYEARYKDYEARIVQEAERLVVESQKAHESLLAAKQVKAAMLAEATASASRPLDTATKKAELELAEKQAAVEAAKTNRLKAHVEDAKAGYYLALGTEPPRLNGLLADLELRTARLTAESERLTDNASNLDLQIREIEQGVRARAKRRVESPVKGVVWTRQVNVGQYVSPGGELYRIADHKTLHVQAYFHRRYLEGMATGNRVSVYLAATRKVVNGTVKVIQALGVASIGEDYAVNPPAPDEDHFRVVVALDPGGAKLAEIGGVAKVAVLGEADGWMNRAMMWLYLRFES